MSAMETLYREHRIISAVVACLDAATTAATKRGTVDAKSFRQCIEFFRGFADACHHQKEEVALFPLLEERGIPRDGGPIGVMLHEHDLGRGYLQAMDQNLAGAERREADACQRLFAAARGYSHLLTEHIDKENEVLFPMADQILSAADQTRLAAEFAVDGSSGCTGQCHHRQLDVARELCQRWNVPFPLEATPVR
ncbi:MAG: hemerythrin domain-containing protein [Planctomycetota bacterium]